MLIAGIALLPALIIGLMIMLEIVEAGTTTYTILIHAQLILICIGFIFLRAETNELKSIAKRLAEKNLRRDNLCQVRMYEGCNKSHLALHTSPDLNTYNSSLITINFALAGICRLNGLMEFNCPVNLSQLYAILSKVAKRVGKTYEKKAGTKL